MAVNKQNTMWYLPEKMSDKQKTSNWDIVKPLIEVIRKKIKHQEDEPSANHTMSQKKVHSVMS